MQLRVLGSGTISGRTNRKCSGYLLDEQILMDCGPGIWSALYRRDQRMRPIDHILISHFHVDHIADLVPLLWRQWVLEKERQNPINLYGPRGLPDWFDKLTAVHHDWVKDLSISLIEMDEAEIEVGSYSVAARPTGHTDNSICFRIGDTDGKSAFYSGDSGWHENLIQLADSSDLAIIDCASSVQDPKEDHLTPVLAAKIADLAGVKRLMLTHLYPEAWQFEPAMEASQYFKGAIILAQDDLLIFI
ncbi:MAG: MBL fold metallo-hydrolase [Spirochaetales bacterium]|nr:MBL fold metallo-hydrolase [Spirochaetales bacterium]